MEGESLTESEEEKRVGLGGVKGMHRLGDDRFEEGEDGGKEGKKPSFLDK